jgi:hypothetical protein
MTSLSSQMSSTSVSGDGTKSGVSRRGGARTGKVSKKNPYVEVKEVAFAASGA